MGDTIFDSIFDDDKWDISQMISYEMKMRMIADSAIAMHIVANNFKIIETDDTSDFDFNLRQSIREAITKTISI